MKISTTPRAALAIGAAAALSLSTLGACSISSGSSSSGSSKGTTTAKPAPKSGCSANLENHEVSIGDHNFGPLEIAVNYFQPGQMMAGSMMLNYDKSAAHLEVDTRMTKKGEEWGYNEGETPAHMDIDYVIKDSAGALVDSGKLMEMNAADGSHYGTNIATGKMKDGKYKVTFTINKPTNYPLHKDLVTGVAADAWWNPMVKTFNWDYKTPTKLTDPVENCDVPAFKITPDLKAAEDPDKNPAGHCDEPEINIGAAKAGPLDFSINYFQPAGMLSQWLSQPTMMPEYQDSIAHLEADIHVTDSNGTDVVGSRGTDYGYRDGETPANLQIKYSIIDPSGAVKDSGDFMEMNAKDGSHYGTNLKKSINLVPNTNYTLKLDVKPPKGYSLHIDKQTGVKVRHWFEPFTIEMPWKYTGNQAACIVTPWKKAFPPMP